MGSQQLAQLNERSHNDGIDRDGHLCRQDSAEHRYAPLREDVRAIAATAAPDIGGANLVPQSFPRLRNRS